jgi:hypothetical protein
MQWILFALFASSAGSALSPRSTTYKFFDGLVLRVPGARLGDRLARPGETRQEELRYADGEENQRRGFWVLDAVDREIEWKDVAGLRTRRPLPGP